MDSKIITISGYGHDGIQMLAVDSTEAAQEFGDELTPFTQLAKAGGGEVMVGPRGCRMLNAIAISHLQKAGAAAAGVKGSLQHASGVASVRCVRG
ncbi:hypothetical protein [Chromobacterium vaccinii]|uniref:hypothetical protein n=1 Tax=Chromobacterium vaccinii TaxID=1108595 RepID=UPI000617FC1A|nr:hypothetical protein [Chromobacterium vaccinii]